MCRKLPSNLIINGKTILFAMQSPPCVKSSHEELAKAKWSVSQNGPVLPSVSIQATGLPCLYAARAVIFSKGQVNDYVDKWFTVIENRQSYRNGILSPIAASDSVDAFAVAFEDIDRPVLSPALSLMLIFDMILMAIPTLYCHKI